MHPSQLAALWERLDDEARNPELPMMLRRDIALLQTIVLVLVTDTDPRRPEIRSALVELLLGQVEGLYY